MFFFGLVCFIFEEFPGGFGLKFIVHILYTFVSPSSEFEILNLVKTATKFINVIFDALNPLFLLVISII